MAENRHIQSSKTARRNIRVLDVVTTTDATPKVAYSVGLGQGRTSFIQAKATVIRSDFGAQQAIDIQAGFRRAIGGSVVKATVPNNKGFEVSNGDFSGTAPSMDLIANTTAQTIDVEITGKAANNLRWYIELLSIQNID